MKVLLTSCGLETDGIKAKFLEFIQKEIKEIRALFIPTAAVDADAIDVLPKCMNDLLKCGITKKNITVYDLHKPMSVEELRTYDVVYLCGGRTEYLLDRINEQNFNYVLLQYMKEDGIVIGVSAGSIIFGQNLKNNLGFLEQKLDVHCSDTACEKLGRLDLSRKETIKLGNKQAIVFETENNAYIID